MVYLVSFTSVILWFQTHTCMLIFISCTIILDILLHVQAPTARSARSFSRSDLRGTAELHIGTNKQMGAWKIGIWLSFCMVSSRGCVEVDQISWFLDTSCQIFFIWNIVAMAFQKLVYKHHGCKHWSSSVFTKWCNWITESPCDSDEPSSRQRLVHITTLEPSTSWWKKMSLGWGWMTGGHYITKPNKALL